MGCCTTSGHFLQLLKLGGTGYEANFAAFPHMPPNPPVVVVFLPTISIISNILLVSASITIDKIWPHLFNMKVVFDLEADVASFNWRVIFDGAVIGDVSPDGKRHALRLKRFINRQLRMLGLFWSYYISKIRLSVRIMSSSIYALLTNPPTHLFLRLLQVKINSVSLFELVRNDSHSIP